MSHMLYALNFQGIITEYGGVGTNGIADLFGITSSGYTHEFEVKTAKSDLAGELKSIKFHLPANKGLFAQQDFSGATKGFKHRHYLNPTQSETSKYPYTLCSDRDIPNKFSFVVSDDLKEFALKELENTPYGLWVVFWHENGGHPFSKMMRFKKAEFLHKTKPSNEIISRMFHKACTEIEGLRSKRISC